MNIKNRIKKFEQHKDAIIYNKQLYSYRLLCDLMDTYRRKLKPGHLYPVIGDANPENIAKLLGGLDNNAILCPMQQLVSPHIWQHEGHPMIQTLKRYDKPGLILITSGTSGTPKAALHDINKMIQDKWQVIDSQRWAPKKSLTTLLLLGFDHIGGFNTICSTLFNGGTLVVPESRDPQHIADLILKFNVECLPASPTFLRMFLMKTNVDLPSLKLITYGSEPMPQSVLDELHERYPDCKIKQTFGTTEMGISSTRSESDGSLWMQIKDAVVIDGMLYTRTNGSFKGYLNVSYQPYIQDQLYCTGDKVISKDGDWYKIIGRESEFINIGGEKVHPSQIEAVLLTLPDVEDCRVEGEPNPIMGQIIRAIIKPVGETVLGKDQESALKERIKTLFISNNMPEYSIPQRIVFTDKPLHNINRLKKERN